MELITYRFTLDTNRNGVQRTLQGFETGDALARELRISLTDGNELYELPIDNSVVATMYITSPNGIISVNACDIVNNEIVYKLLDTDTMEAGIIGMQVKLTCDSEVLVAPRFALDVWESSVDDSEAIQNPVFTALEQALTEAREAYNGRVVSVVIDDDYLFVVTFADGHTYESDVIQKALTLISDIERYVESAKEASVIAVEAKASAQASAVQASTYELNAKASADRAEAIESVVLGAEASAVQAKDDAQTSADNAYRFAQEASQASGYADAAALSATNAKASEDNAKASEDIVKGYSDSARTSEGNALTYRTLAESYTHGRTGQRSDEDTDNAWYYMKQAQSASSGGLLPSGNVTFEQLMALTDVRVGAMYHVTTAFTTNDRFEDYALLGPEEYPAGTNVYYKSDGKWCAMVGSEVIGIKGEAETDYRTGHVTITKENLGIGNATTSKAGLVKPDGTTITVDPDGTLHGAEQGAGTWADLENKPFETLDENTLEVEDGTLKVIGGFNPTEITYAEWLELDETTRNANDYIITDYEQFSAKNITIKAELGTDVEDAIEKLKNDIEEYTVSAYLDRADVSGKTIVKNGVAYADLQVVTKTALSTESITMLDGFPTSKVPIHIVVPSITNDYLATFAMNANAHTMYYSARSNSPTIPAGKVFYLHFEYLVN